ncbi:CehA/McbA family metallohydrolase [Flavobacterium sp.]|uniref:CehA/McbA family metallohydrolase n=1 Tax=Flavobacterium sp. TaxID=239 RepID=UPI0025FECBAE|nr:CehA/McbA family metallohydrolase [Flavobacterium sp.]
MNRTLLFAKQIACLGIMIVSLHSVSAQIIISQYYEGTGTNKWIELTNTGNTAINTASPQLKLGIWAVTGSTGNIAFTGARSSTVSLTVTIPAYGSVLIGNTGNGTELSYLTAASAAQTSNTVINFNGNDGVALLDASNTILDQFGNGINATDISYVRSTSVTGPSATYTASQWTSVSIANVQAAGTTDPNRLNYQLSALCTPPVSQATSLIFGSPTSTSNTGSFTATAADGYLVVYSGSASLSANPANGTNYTAGTVLGNGTVQSSGSSTTLSLTGLSPSTTYYVTVFAYNNVGCSGGTAYQTASPLTGNFATIAPPCAAPVNQPTGLTFGSPSSTSNTASFTPTAADGYLTVYSTSASLSANPANGTTYTAGNALGNGTVVSSSTSTSLSLTGLNPSTTYYVTLFAYNNLGCSGGIAYKTGSPLTGSFATIAPPCVAPANSPTGLTFGSPTSTSNTGSFTAATADGYLTVYSTSASLSANPANGTTYATGNTLGNGTVLSSGSSTSFLLSGLSPSTTYYVTVFAYNNSACGGGTAYKTSGPLTGSFATIATPCTTPVSQPTALSFSGTTSTTATASFTTTTADGYLVVYSTASSLTVNPSNGMVYTAGAAFGNAVVVSSGATSSFIASGLSAVTTYYFYVFSYNNINCSGGPIYKTTSPLTGSATTLEAPLYYYFGNFHSHSQYSDGNGLPSGDFSFGDTANCMDFLGISEHNHATAGMSLANYSLGRSQAAAATTSSFLAMYGMEWGVISGGGHVVVYGVDKLLGWEAGNYDIYVPQSMYTGASGLFSVINSYSGSNAFATLAHPNNADYNGIMSTYDSGADDAVVGSAVENGPSSSTDVTYTDPPSSMLYLSYYRNMLARGYHLGPTMDHDNHNVTHGHTATTRTVVLATALNESSVSAAMRAMRFYATEDCGAYVTFKVNSKQIGAIMTAAGTPTVTVTTTTTNPVTSLKIYSGVPGSGSNATILTSTTSGSITYTHSALANLSSRYYYIDITESDGKRTVTAPIWYTRNDAARRGNTVAVAEFLAIAQTKDVILKWTTANETEKQSYTIERSMDNTNFELMTTQAGRGASKANQNYRAVDESAFTGMMYYRLTQYDAEGNIIYTDTQKVNRELEPKFRLTVYPNPVGDNATIQVENTQGEAITFSVYDITGKWIYQQEVLTQTGDQEVAIPMQSLAPGIYFVKAATAKYTVTAKVTKL